MLMGIRGPLPLASPADLEMQHKGGGLLLQLYEMRQVDVKVVVNHNLADTESPSSELCFVYLIV